MQTLDHSQTLVRTDERRATSDDDNGGWLVIDYTSERQVNRGATRRRTSQVFRVARVSVKDVVGDVGGAQPSHGTASDGVMDVDDDDGELTNQRKPTTQPRTLPKPTQMMVVVDMHNQESGSPTAPASSHRKMTQTEIQSRTSSSSSSFTRMIVISACYTERQMWEVRVQLTSCSCDWNQL
jgi:hypothetical protein